MEVRFYILTHQSKFFTVLRTFFYNQITILRIVCSIPATYINKSLKLFFFRPPSLFAQKIDVTRVVKYSTDRSKKKMVLSTLFDDSGSKVFAPKIPSFSEFTTVYNLGPKRLGVQGFVLFNLDFRRILLTRYFIVRLLCQYVLRLTNRYFREVLDRRRRKGVGRRVVAGVQREKGRDVLWYVVKDFTTRLLT